MSDDEWVKERAMEIALQFGRRDNVVDLQNAILVAMNTAAGKYGYALDAFEHGRQSILDRLKEPDEALVEVAAERMFGHRFTARETKMTMREAIRALALALEQGGG